MKKVALMGTCNSSSWREALKPLLIIEYFDPVKEDWTPEDQAEEVRQRQTCDFVLYVLTPRMESFYSIAEVVDDSNKQPQKTVLCVLPDDVNDGKRIVFDEQSRKSMDQVMEMVRHNQAVVCSTLAATAEYLNAQAELQGA